MSTREGNEAFYLENGIKKDAAIHDAILGSVDPQADERLRFQSFQAAVERGFDPAAAARIYGLTGAYDLGGGPSSLR